MDFPLCRIPWRLLHAEEIDDIQPQYIAGLSYHIGQLYSMPTYREIRIALPSLQKVISFRLHILDSCYPLNKTGFCDLWPFWTTDFQAEPSSCFWWRRRRVELPLKQHLAVCVVSAWRTAERATVYASHD